MPAYRRSRAPAGRREAELGERLSETVLEFQRAHPETSPAEVQRAMELAWGRSLAPLRRRRVLVCLAVVMALVLFSVGLFVLGT
ncbi:MAG: hypothetical protein RRA92_08800 [Gemmatimonadota bacterium]|nr:hypothetical protein [Gemmatimonadota bacterium]